MDPDNVGNRLTLLKTDLSKQFPEIMKFLLRIID